MKTSYRIAEVSFGYSHWNAAYNFKMDGQNFEVRRYGADFQVEIVRELIAQLRSEVDAFAITSLPPSLVLGNQSFIHRHYFEIMNTPSSVPLCDGTGLREILNIQSLESAIEKGDIKPEAGFFFPAALLHTEIEEYLRNRPDAPVAFGDLYSILGIPLVLRPFPGLMRLAKVGLNIATIKGIKSNASTLERPIQEITKTWLPPQIQSCQYVVADLPLISYFGQNMDIFKGKELIIYSHHVAIEKYIELFGFRKVHSLMPEQYRKLTPYMHYSVLEAALRLIHKRTASLNFEEWQELLSIPFETMQTVKKYCLPRKTSSQVKVSKTFYKVQSKITQNKAPDFAFVIHALSHHDFERLPLVGNIIKKMPQEWNDSFDKKAAHLPPFVYGQLKHIVSEHDGREVSGIIYALPATPKVLKSQDPEITYAQIQKCCNDAAARGAKIIGLGAYTKVVGDSGVTINKNSPLPVTTGNSLSASSTLWGLHEVVKKMGLLKMNPEKGHFEGTAMVIGATGSIGSVSAKLLSLVFDKLVIVAPRIERLQELAKELKAISPKCQVICSTDANEWAPQVDALVTATSAFDQKIIDVMRLKPGCVVCDCSRPLDFSKEDARKRPDVIIMESGELILPGPYEVTCDLGLPGKSVYACLAETAILAMEGRFESFTLGRDIDWLKVKEIYKLSLKHGVKLASIQGHMGTITDKEIKLTRELAISRSNQE